MRNISKFRHAISLAAICIVAASPAAAQDQSAHAQKIMAVSCEERSAVLDLIARYGQYFDSGNGAAYAALYTNDGELEYPGDTPEAPRRSLKGRQTLMDFTNQVKRERGLARVGIHHLGNTIIVKVGENHIRARTPIITGDVDATKNYSAKFGGYGVYEDDIVKTDKGWRFLKRSAYIYGSSPIPQEFLSGFVDK